MIIDKYKTILTHSEGFFKDKGSKFFAHAFPVSCEKEIDEIRAELRKNYFDARHHVYAFMLGENSTIYRASDDGEPSNSSGLPVLGQIRSNELTNILIVVIRYFGGTKLGIPGLINAYKTAAAEAIKNSEIITKTILLQLTVIFEYPMMNVVMRIAKDENLEIISQKLETSCSITYGVPKSKFDHIFQRFNEIHGIKII